MTDQSSIMRFIEDNWLARQRIMGSFDALAGPLDNMFDFSQNGSDSVILDPDTGRSEVRRQRGQPGGWERQINRNKGRRG